jgi:hypothetical protein
MTKIRNNLVVSPGSYQSAATSEQGIDLWSRAVTRRQA